MKPELNQSTKAFWLLVHTKKRDYPFWCTTPTELPRPELLKGYGRFIRFPLFPTAYWGFQDREKRDLFQSRFNAEDWTP